MIDKVAKEVKIIVSIGANFEPETHVKKAKEMLADAFPNICFSHELWTKPIGMRSDDFLNLLAVANTRMPLNEVEGVLKNIETTCGRKGQDKEKGIVKLDLDILLYDKMRLHEGDWQREYVKELLAIPLFSWLT